MDAETESTPLILFGRDVTKIPCFRNCFLYGSGTGFVGGLVTFMFTSKPRIASHMTVATFVASTWTYWVYCRYNWSKQEAAAAQLKLLIEQHAAMEGTSVEKKFKNPSPSPLIDV